MSRTVRALPTRHGGRRNVGKLYVSGFSRWIEHRFHGLSTNDMPPSSSPLDPDAVARALLDVLAEVHAYIARNRTCRRQRANAIRLTKRAERCRERAALRQFLREDVIETITENIPALATCARSCRVGIARGAGQLIRRPHHRPTRLDIEEYLPDWDYPHILNSVPL